jgi:rare lipoprotein A
MKRNIFLIAIAAALLVACSSKPTTKPIGPATGNTTPRPGVYYKDDGPPTALPADLDRIADAAPQDEPLHRFANRPYNVFGVNYSPMTLLSPLKQRGIASWYGKKFHGQKTAIGETYDMFAMSAAHPTAPLPSFARITNVRDGRSVVVRINDRGPFHAGRIVDLSYAAAHRIGVAQAGSGEVDFELLLPPYVRASESAANARALPPTTPTSTETSASSDNLAVAAAPPIAQFNRAETRFFVQLGAFGNFGNAQVFQGRMANELGINPVVRQVGGLFRVQLGPFASMSDAQSARQTAQQRIGSTLPIVNESATQ